MTRPAPETRTFPVNGIDLAVHQWAPVGSPVAASLVLAHATGFHGRVFDAIIEQFPAHPAHAIDLRGHGQSGGGPIDDWRLVASDVAGFLEQAGITGAVGIGHSMGAHTLLQVAADHAGIFSRLVLFDPVILAPDYYGAGEAPFTADNPHPTIRRKRDFASPQAMMERFRGRDPYCLFDARVFADYCRYGLLPAPSGEGMELACAPEVEASVYASSRSNPGILDAARKVDIPVLVVRAQMTDLQDFKSSPTWPELAQVLPQGTDLYRPDRTHFHPFEDPDDAARTIAGFLG
ncbi:alpha/beta fold hydrolase [Erythrobacter dokdonensis]|uniref:Alpha/beta hydrolase fold protein n=1 Tax=Erythrobacter dokdonensis DSW-74 TaxID=1300349 RepID=A0A1A7BED3_9SPHN|nr:alpha/beta hydrolase [Erythrobacter dokdonensis]OBV10893.1 Alpha/beta hydrolase fold protein [Erythrobacter dokdonensis DSW-74]